MYYLALVIVGVNLFCAYNLYLLNAQGMALFSVCAAAIWACVAYTKY